MAKSIGILIGIEPAQFWSNSFLYSCEEEYTLSQKIKASYVHSTERLIDDLCAINNVGKIGRSFSDISKGG